MAKESIINYQKYVENLFKNACYAACLSFYFREIGFNWIEITKDILHGVEMGYLTEDCYVKAPTLYIRAICGTKYKDVEKINIKSLDELPDGNWIVEMKSKTGSHFLITNNKSELIFDPSGKSESWKMNQPISYRKYII